MKKTLLLLALPLVLSACAASGQTHTIGADREREVRELIYTLPMHKIGDYYRETSDEESSSLCPAALELAWGLAPFVKFVAQNGYLSYSDELMATREVTNQTLMAALAGYASKYDMSATQAFDKCADDAIADIHSLGGFDATRTLIGHKLTILTIAHHLQDLKKQPE